MVVVRDGRDERESEMLGERAEVDKNRELVDLLTNREGEQESVVLIVKFWKREYQIIMETKINDDIQLTRDTEL